MGAQDYCEATVEGVRRYIESVVAHEPTIEQTTRPVPSPTDCTGCFGARHAAFCVVTVELAEETWRDQLCRSGLVSHLVVAENTAGFRRSHIVVHGTPPKQPARAAA